MAKHPYADPRCILCQPRGYEVWAKWDDSAQVYELFASEQADDYIGCADTLAEAKAIAKEWIRSQNED